jgi:D-alanyl-D-alanine carboxypeptidase
MNRWKLVYVVAAAVVCWGCSTDSSTPAEVDVLADLGVADGVGVDDVALPDDVVVVFPDLVASHLLKAMEEYLAFSGDPGVSVAIRLETGATFAEVAGVSHMVEKTPMTTHTAFRVGSNTKPYISALIMTLVDEGLVGLDDPFSKYVSDYPKWDDITIRMLLGMQSGIPDYMLGEAFMMSAVFDPDSLTTPQVLLDFVKDEELLFEPGTDCIYTNTNYILVGLIIEEVTGQPAHEALQTRILEPLGLVDTYLDVVDEPKENLSHGYLDLAIVGFFFGLGADAVALLPKSWFMEDYLVDATYLFPPMFAWTDGGLVTTPVDAMEFMHALLTGGVISEESLAEMQKTALCPILGTPVDYGLGLSTSTGPFGTRWGHGGLNFGYEANTIFFPERDVTLSHMHNYLPEQAYRLENQILAILDATLEDPPTPSCTLPEGLFGGKGGEIVEFRFKGVIAAEDEPAPLGIALIRAFMNEENLALYGYGTFANEQTITGVRRIDITSSAPALTDGVDRRSVVVSIAAEQLAAADGEVTLTDDTDLAVLVMEEVHNLDTMGVEKFCVVAVTDSARTSQLHACGGPEYSAEVGDTLRVFGVVPVTREVEAIDTFLTQIPMDRCSCADADGGWHACL